MTNTKDLTITVSGQRMGPISPFDITPPLTTDPHDPGTEYEPVSVLTGLVERVLLEPLTPGGTVTVTGTDPTGGTMALDAEELGAVLGTPLLSDGHGHSQDLPENNEAAMAVLAQTVHHIGHDAYPFLRRAMLAQALGELGLPGPNPPRVVYSAGSDVSPAAREVLSAAGGTGTDAYEKSMTAWHKLFAGIGASYGPTVLGIGLLGPDTYAQFGEHLLTTASALSTAGKIDAATMDKCRQTAALTMEDLTEGLTLRKSQFDFTEDYSYARVVVSAAFDFVRNEQRKAHTANRPAAADVFVFDVAEWICPQALVFVNADAHARREPRDISLEWRTINNAMDGGLRIVSTNRISKLDLLPKELAGHKNVVRARELKAMEFRRDTNENDFSDKPPTPKEAAKQIVRHLQKMAKTNRSENITRYVKRDFNRSSRRHPDDPNFPGRRIANRFYNDIHIYADTSGSMSETDYRDIVMLAATIAARLKVNLYFSSHSHVLSNEVKLPTREKSVGQVVEILRKVEKVSGGNNFAVVYNYIQASPERQRRLNIIATDFGWAAHGGSNFVHPANMIYVPAFDRHSSYAWDQVRDQAADFVNSMRPYDSTIDRRLYGMGYTVPTTSGN